MKITFLESTVPLTKTYTKNPDGTIKKTPYPMTWEFTSHEENCKDLTQLHAALVKHAALGHCLLKGTIQTPLVTQSRAGSTSTSDATEFVVLDLDGLPDTYNGAQITIDSFLQTLGLDQCSHIVQWSASYGIENKHLRAHVFLILAKATAAPQLKQGLVQINHETPMLNAAMKLTATGNSISWPLDISACQNDKLIYIAPPVLKNIKDPMKGIDRISLVIRKQPKMHLVATINSIGKNTEMTHKRIAELRDLAQLPKKKIIYKTMGSVEVQAKPDACTITEMKQERGFVYFNINGGDSWAYYHPENNPDFVFNFKGEPNYLTKELLPDYWSELTQKGARANSSGKTYLAFCDRATSGYWRGTFDESTDTLNLFPAKNETQVRHFAKQHGLPLGDFIPEWDLVFDPHDSVRVDQDNRIINLFQLTPYMKATAKQIKQCPKTILKLITHVLGGDPAVITHFINWLAYILQQRERTKTAWVLHGVPGTGKGILFNHVLRPIFGDKQTSAQNMQGLAEPYNHWMKQCFIVFVDEVQTKALINEQGVVAKLKNYITEKFVQVREMYQGTHEARNFCSFILASNMSDVVTIEADDRRFNVGGYQKDKLVITDKELEQIEKELQAFHDYLLYFPLDKQKAGEIIDTSDRATMISLSESSVDTVGNAINAGNFGFLMEQLPNSTTSSVVDGRLHFDTQSYREVLQALLQRTDRNNGKCNIARDELKVIFTYVVGGMPASPNKFTSLLKHHRIHMQDVWINTGVTAGKERGIVTTFTDLPQFPTYLAVFVPPVKKTKPKSKSLAVVI